MALAEMLSYYKGTTKKAPVANGIKGRFTNAMLDCDCTDCGSSADCSNCDSPGTTH